MATSLAPRSGRVLRIYSGDTRPGEIFGRHPTQLMWLGIAVLMLIPIVMVVLTLTLSYPAIRWTTIVVAVLLGLFNVLGLAYPGAYDNFLIEENRLGGTPAYHRPFKSVRSVSEFVTWLPVPGGVLIRSDLLREIARDR